MITTHEFEQAYQKGRLKGMYDNLNSYRGIHGASEQRTRIKKGIADQIEMMKDKGYAIDPPPEPKPKKQKVEEVIGYTINPLEWYNAKSYDWRTTQGNYRVFMQNPNTYVAYPCLEDYLVDSAVEFPTLEEAKDFCNKHHKEQLLKFLSPL